MHFLLTNTQCTVYCLLQAQVHRLRTHRNISGRKTPAVFWMLYWQNQNGARHWPKRWRRDTLKSWKLNWHLIMGPAKWSFHQRISFLMHSVSLRWARCTRLSLLFGNLIGRFTLEFHKLFVALPSCAGRICIAWLDELDMKIISAEKIVEKMNQLYCEKNLYLRDWHNFLPTFLDAPTSQNMDVKKLLTSG